MNQVALIRLATSADADSILALWRRAGMLEYTPDPERDIELTIADERNALLVAELDSKVVGSVIATCDGRRGWVFRLVVSERYRRQGIGRRLVTGAEDHLRAMAVPQVNVLVFDREVVSSGFWNDRGYEAAEPVQLLFRRL